MLYSLQLTYYLLFKMSQGKLRPFNFQTNSANLRDFVYKGAFDQSQSFASKFPAQANPPKAKDNMFDRYYRNNLLLKDCHPADVQQIVANPVVAEDQLSKNMIEQIVNRSCKNNHLSQTMSHQFKGDMLSTHEGFIRTGMHHEEAKPSQEYKENELLFNYKKIAEEKRAKKHAFLSQIQERIAQAEREADQLQKAQGQQKMHLLQINKMHKQIDDRLTMTAYTGKVNQILSQNDVQEEFAGRESPRKTLNIYMQPKEVNEVLEEHFQMNENLLDEINRISKPRGFSQKKQSPNKTSSNFGTTIRKGATQKNIPSKSTQKKLINTVNYPPKQKR